MTEPWLQVPGRTRELTHPVTRASGMPLRGRRCSFSPGHCLMFSQTQTASKPLFCCAILPTEPITAPASTAGHKGTSTARDNG